MKIPDGVNHFLFRSLASVVCLSLLVQPSFADILPSRQISDRNVVPASVAAFVSLQALNLPALVALLPLAQREKKSQENRWAGSFSLAALRQSLGNWRDLAGVIVPLFLTTAFPWNSSKLGEAPSNRPLLKMGILAIAVMTFIVHLWRPIKVRNSEEDEIFGKNPLDGIVGNILAAFVFGAVWVIGYVALTDPHYPYPYGVGVVADSIITLAIARWVAKRFPRYKDGVGSSGSNGGSQHLGIAGLIGAALIAGMLGAHANGHPTATLLAFDSVR